MSALHEKQLADLARSSSAVESISPYHPTQGSALDPNSADFDARQWTQAMYRLQQDAGKQGRSLGYSFRRLSAFGHGTDMDVQKTVSSVFLEVINVAKRLIGIKGQRIDILHPMDGLVRAGEMLVVLGPPGSGCSTFLKSITGDTDGFMLGTDAKLNFQGISYRDMTSRYRGEASYTAELDEHFPNLTVGETLFFAAKARAPRKTPGGLSRDAWASLMRDVMMATLGISHTLNTKIGNDYIRGVSGGERKRVTIAEAALSRAAIQAWDNSTRGLDSANAIEFCKTLRLQADYFGITPAVAIYQAPASAFDLFDKVLLLYNGHEIYFGPVSQAKDYFERLGFECPARQTTPDFLTSMTAPDERRVRPGAAPPQTPLEFATAWRASKERAQLLLDIADYDAIFPIGGPVRDLFEDSRREEKASVQRASSPYTLSYREQVAHCLWRGFRRLVAEPTLTLYQLLSNLLLAIIVGTVFLNLKQETNGFFKRGSLLFFAVLLNALASALEVLLLYEQRDICEKHARYAYYHPSAEAFASILTDLPYKISNAITFNVALYFMTNLRREAGPFFFFVLVSFLVTLSTSHLFRTLAAVSRSLVQALVPTALITLALVMFSGFVIPVVDMLGWSRWIHWLNPLSYGFESLMINEFHGRDFSCDSLIPTYGSLVDGTQVCYTVGSVAGQDFVNGASYIEAAYGYVHDNKWRNVYILAGFTIFWGLTYLIGVDFIQAKKSKGEVLVFRRRQKRRDVEAASPVLPSAKAQMQIQQQTAVFHWSDVCYDVRIKKETRRILDHVDGWVKPGTRTALMGVSGAGKTTLLDVLASRITIGVVGEMLVDGQIRNAAFQRQTGYAQQQDLHLDTSTVREALTFSALLRQPAHIPRQDRIDYVDEVLSLLDMVDYADAVVGVPGEGLNVEQRKRLTIGVELAARPALLLFLDEPTSGLDAQTSWAICDLLEKLTKAGQAVLCTIHQPSAMLFQRFDRLLLLAQGGQTVYFGDIGEDSQTLVSYFEANGAPSCPPKANPAEWMLEVIGAAPGSHSDRDWHQVWHASPEYRTVKATLHDFASATPGSLDVQDQYAAPLFEQFKVVTQRVFSQYWRTPTYIYSKLLLCVLGALFVGFVFYKSPNNLQGMQNQMFAVFMLFTTFPQLVSLMMPHFIKQRSLYEARERPSKVYSWKVFIMANIVVELPWNTFFAVLMFFAFYYPVGFARNAEFTGAVAIRGFLFFLYVWQYMLFISTFGSLMIAALDSELASNLAELLFALCLIFCGVLVNVKSLGKFWIFMYYVSPFTYLVSSMLSVGIANAPVTCSQVELLRFNAPSGTSCGEFMNDFITAAGGYLVDPLASVCEYCRISETNTFLAAVSSKYAHRWRNFGILWLYILANIVGAIFLYWLARVPRTRKAQPQLK
ncbi:putative multidrug resistance ABC transporter [Protomyces lactucae-debilis]|uniref:Putative multidrug resistance ABC transporter n=1 Tax=Protomyces lactucae-debilis TaxID=2754530 RepID=A0A1Y2FIK3_PROLT|nr:putative multidrug resistance ABC transporter [Protomyces lactucae-debilis]ORY83753.1 putative multidrug resistance ABC transporter [Protomyces lactucae-debilis]